MITPMTEVQIWNFDDEIVKVKLVILTVWESALRLELKGIQPASVPVAPIVRGFLNSPDDYPLDMLSEHITNSLAEVKEQMGPQLEQVIFLTY